MLRYRIAIIVAMEHRMLYVNNIEISVTIPLDDALADGPREGVLHARPHGKASVIADPIEGCIGVGVGVAPFPPQHTRGRGRFCC